MIVMTVDVNLSHRYRKINGGDLIWNASIAWLAGFFLAGSVAIAVAGCTGDVTRLPYPDAGSPSPIQLGSGPIEESNPEPPRCFRHETLKFDGGSLTVPLPCNPRYDARHDWGDPIPNER